MDTSVSPCDDFYNYTCGMFDTAAAAGGMWYRLIVRELLSKTTTTIVLIMNTFTDNKYDGRTRSCSGPDKSVSSFEPHFMTHWLQYACISHAHTHMYTQRSN